MGRKASADESLDVVFVDNRSDTAIVAIEDDGEGGPVPQGSVTVEGTRRAARKVGEDQTARDGGSIAEATIVGDQGPGEAREADGRRRQVQKD